MARVAEATARRMGGILVGDGKRTLEVRRMSLRRGMSWPRNLYTGHANEEMRLDRPTRPTAKRLNHVY